jgi:hypothetical protein
MDGGVGQSGSVQPTVLVLTRRDTGNMLPTPTPPQPTQLPTHPSTTDVVVSKSTIERRRTSWMERVKDEQTWLFNHQFCAFEMPVDDDSATTPFGGTNQSSVIDTGRGRGDVDLNRRTVCEHIFETDLTFKLPQR